MQHLEKNLKSAKILIVDDEDMALISLESITKEFSEVYKATTSEDAIEIAKSIRPDLIILDINLDSKDGFEVKQSITCTYPDIPFIFITTSNDYAAQAYEAGAVDFIAKPIDLKMAKHRIKNQLDRTLSKKALKETKNRISSMVNSLPDAILMTDSEGLVVECNEAAEKLSGYEKSEIIGHHADDVLVLINPKSGKRQPLFANSLSKAVTIQPILKYQIENQSGELFEVNCSITPIVDDENIVSGATGAIRIKHQITGSTTALAPNDIVARIMYLDYIVNNGSVLGDTLDIIVIDFDDIERVIKRCGVEVKIQIHEDTLNSIQSCLPSEGVMGFIRDDRLIVVIPHFINHKIDITNALSMIPKSIQFFGDEISFTTSNKVLNCNDVDLDALLEDVTK